MKIAIIGSGGIGGYFGARLVQAGHVDPKLKTKGYALLYNPLEKAIKKNIRLPLYYTGLSSKALISINEGKAQEYDINRNYEVMLEVELKANSQTRIIIE